MPSVNFKLIFRLFIFTLSITVIITAFWPKNPPLQKGQVEGTTASPLLVDNKFCENPSSATQVLCPGFITDVLAANTPYQNVSGDVAITGQLSVTGGSVEYGNLKVADFKSGGSSAFIKVARSDGAANLLGVDTNGDAYIGGYGGNYKVRILAQGSERASFDSGVWPGGWTKSLSFANGTMIRWSQDTSGLYAGFGHTNGGFYWATSQFDSGAANPASYIMTLGTNGNLTIAGRAFKATGGSWEANSDTRLKKNIRPIAGALEKIQKIQGINFEWINPEEHGNAKGSQGGFLAQDIEKIFPQWISETEATGRDNNLTNGEKIKNLSLPFEFDALLVEAIKEQQKEIDELKKQIQDLQNK